MVEFFFKGMLIARNKSTANVSIFGYHWSKRLVSHSVNCRLQGVGGNADLIPVLVGPEWVMRVYHDISPDDILRQELIQPIEDFYPHVDFCYVRDIEGFGNLSGKDLLVSILRLRQVPRSSN